MKFHLAINLERVDEGIDMAAVARHTLEMVQMAGTPDEVIAKLKLYEALGVDAFIYYASLGLCHAEQKRSMDLFCREVIPAFG